MARVRHSQPFSAVFQSFSAETGRREPDVGATTRQDGPFDRARR
jgi:hypothetical protein